MFGEYWLTRFCFQRALGIIYFIGFLILVNQARPLIGERGLLPAPLFLKQVRFLDAPSLFHAHFSNPAMAAAAWIGLALAVLAVTGIADAHGYLLSAAVWALLWILYLSFVNIGQTFYGFGWESLLLEIGFLAIFLGPSKSTPPAVVIWLLRWVLFRLMFGAGMIKLRGDPCWRDLTCMFYHYETQPMPNPLSWYFHRLPGLLHKTGVAFTHFVELAVPWFYFGPKAIAAIAGALTIIFQVTLILSGNLSWLNYVTIVVAIACFDDSILSKIITFAPPAGLAALAPVHQGFAVALAAMVLVLSIRPAMNLFSRNQMMNASFDSFHLVNTYGAFGSVTRERNEIVVEGTDESVILPSTPWREYGFRGKPGATGRMPPIVSPYHYRLDWQMWFAAMSTYWRNPWFVNLVAKLLAGDKDTLSLLKENPFPGKPPKFIRARLYLYRFAGPGEKEWWKRTLVSEYLPPLSLDDPRFREVLRERGWLD